MTFWQWFAQIHPLVALIIICPTIVLVVGTIVGGRKPKTRDVDGEK